MNRAQIKEYHDADNAVIRNLILSLYALMDRATGWEKWQRTFRIELDFKITKEKIRSVKIVGYKNIRNWKP